MPNLDKTGPGNLGSKKGKKLGICKKTDVENKEIEENYLFKVEDLKKRNAIKIAYKQLKNN